MNRKIKTSKIDELICAYILGKMCGDGYGVDVDAMTDKEKFQFIVDTFRAEYGFMVERIGALPAFAEWLSGLPSVLTIAFYNSDILSLAEEWGADLSTEGKQEKILFNYFRFMAFKFDKFARREGVDMSADGLKRDIVENGTLR